MVSPQEVREIDPEVSLDANETAAFEAEAGYVEAVQSWPAMPPPRSDTVPSRVRCTGQCYPCRGGRVKGVETKAGYWAVARSW